MKILIETKNKLITPAGIEMTTVGYWRFRQPNNKGALHIEIAQLKSGRYYWAVAGHELVEALWCWVRGITTEECDFFDERCETEFEEGVRDPMIEPGFDRECPYRVGHILGSIWERIVIFGTFGSWSDYDKTCNKIMGITDEV